MASSVSSSRRVGFPVVPITLGGARSRTPTGPATYGYGCRSCRAAVWRALGKGARDRRCPRRAPPAWEGRRARHDVAVVELVGEVGRWTRHDPRHRLGWSPSRARGRELVPAPESPARRRRCRSATWATGPRRARAGGRPNSKDVTTPRPRPRPHAAQNRSGWVLGGSPWRTTPSAVTTSIEAEVVARQPEGRGAGAPMPPPSVRPATPVIGTLRRRSSPDRRSWVAPSTSCQRGCRPGRAPCAPPGRRGTPEHR